MLKLTPNPTFKATVEIFPPGEDSKPEKVKFEFRYKDSDALKVFMEERQKAADGYKGIVENVVVGWEGVDAPFSPEALSQVLTSYLGSAQDIAAKYVKELSKAREGN